MEEILIYKSKLALPFNKDILIKKIYQNVVLDNLYSSPTAPGVQSFINIRSKEIDYILNYGVNKCKEIFFGKKDNLEDYDYLLNSWVYISRDDNTFTHYHNHVQFDLRFPLLKTNLTFVYYIQMPNNLEGDDGKLFFKSNQYETSILPEEGELIIFDSELLHKPELARKSTIDRIVIAGNVVFDITDTKIKKTIL